MKAKIFYILILGSLILHPGYTFALNAKQSSLFNHSFQGILQEDNSQNSNSLLSADINIDDDVSADLDIDDDDDFSVSARKKVSFEGDAFFCNRQYTFRHFWNNSPGKNCCPKIYHLPSSYFISLRVFRL